MSIIINNKEIFNNAYLDNLWGGGSGHGSKKENVKPWIKAVNSIIQEKKISSVLDLGCGDGQWLDLLDLNGVSYIGVDISEIAIGLNKNKNTSNKLVFINDDIINFEYPKVDLIIIKDVLQHLPYNLINKILDKIKYSCKYALFCEDFLDFEKDIEFGDYRGLNLASKKFERNLSLEFVDSYSLVDVSKYQKHIYMYLNKEEVNDY